MAAALCAQLETDPGSPGWQNTRWTSQEFPAGDERLSGTGITMKCERVQGGCGLCGSAQANDRYQTLTCEGARSKLKCAKGRSATTTSIQARSSPTQAGCERARGNDNKAPSPQRDSTMIFVKGWGSLPTALSTTLLSTTERSGGS